MTLLPNASYRLNAIPIKLSMIFFRELEQNILNLYGNTKKPQIAKATLKKKAELKESGFLTSDYTTTLQSSKQCGAETEI